MFIYFHFVHRAKSIHVCRFCFCYHTCQPEVAILEGLANINSSSSSEKTRLLLQLMVKCLIIAMVLSAIPGRLRKTSKKTERPKVRTN